MTARSNGSRRLVDWRGAGLRAPARSLAFLLLIALFTLDAASQDTGPWRATLVSSQGTVEKRLAGQPNWVQVDRDETFERGDSLRTHGYSRAAILLPGSITARLDQNSTVTFAETGAQGGQTQPVAEPDENRSLLDILNGIIHFISREPQALRVLTTFGNAGIEGTEFLVAVTNDATVVTVYEGTVTLRNSAGQATATSGQQVAGRANQISVAQTVIRPRDAVQWTLYYAPVLDIELPGAADEPAPQQVNDSSFYIGRAAARLTVGRVDEANIDISRALTLDSRNVEARALQSIIALTGNDKDETLRLANLAVAEDARSSTALIALSYAQQAFFDIEAAATSVESAIARDPDNALAWARLSELRLSMSDVAGALEAAEMAVSRNASLGRSQTVLGFAHLTRIDLERATEAFQQAIALDDAAPLPHLGLGLTRIRGGDLTAGREQIEIAVILDPGNALIRSYMGKAYYEEKREALAGSQLEIARDLDPLDPTPWFYDAIREQTSNQPVEALQDMQRSIELNDNRAVYRSQLLLDEDLAVRSASTGRIYRDLGFEQLALTEGWKSVSADPGNYSGHRLLADTYSFLPRHETARVSELLQAQLLQPLNLTAIQPQLAETNLYILSGAGPSDAAFNEFNPLFTRNGVGVQLNGIAGGNGIAGNDLVISGIGGRVSYSLGQFHYKSDGSRVNNDQERDVYNALVQAAISPKTTVQVELRSSDFASGDLLALFDRQNFSADLRETEDTDSVRLGIRHTFRPGSTLIANMNDQNSDASLRFPGVSNTTADDDGNVTEVQYLHQADRFSLVGGAGHVEVDSLIVSEDIVFGTSEFAAKIDHDNLYLYSYNRPLDKLEVVLGVSIDSTTGGIVDTDQTNPKLGLLWNPSDSTQLRIAAFKTLQRTFVGHQTIEPTHVAGFNQLFVDPEGTEATRYGIGVDHELSVDLFAGAEFSRRNLDVPGFSFFPVPMTVIEDWNEESWRSYLYWLPVPSWAFRAEYLRDDFTRNISLVGAESFTDLQTDSLLLGTSIFRRNGLQVKLAATFVEQDGVFGDGFGGVVPGQDSFWVFDASLGYRLPDRLGVVSLAIKNAFDKQFNFQDIDPGNPRLSDEKLAVMKFTLSF